MALTGIHVECGLAYTFNDNATLFEPVWSETIALSAATTQSAIGPNGSPPVDGRLVLRVRASAECFAAIGSSPNAAQAIGSTRSTARMHLQAGEIRDIAARVGDKLAAVAA